MPTFSDRSKGILSTVHPDLQAVMLEVVKHFDIAIVCGHRGQADQDAAVKAGRSKTPWPTSKHNGLPSLAVDIAPYKIDWADKERFTYLAGYVLGVAAMLGIQVRWGGDWDSDTQVRDESFRDIGHFELHT